MEHQSSARLGAWLRGPVKVCNSANKVFGAATTLHPRQSQTSSYDYQAEPATENIIHLPGLNIDLALTATSS
jgi:hypothetical protein